MTFLDPAFLLHGQLAEHLSQVRSQLDIQGFSPALGNEYNVVFALPLGVLSYSSIDGTSFRVLWRLTIRSFVDGPPRFDPRKCQTFAAPRQSRGNSHWIRTTVAHATLSTYSPRRRR